MLTFVKLGGSLITDKTQVSTARQAVIARLAQEIKQALSADPDLQIILGHGSGSFGHPPAKKFKTRDGVRSAEEWQGFLEVRQQADALHRIVMDELAQAGLRVVSFPPSAVAVAHHHDEIQWDLTPMKNALQHALIPVVFGDVVFDEEIGGTILSTEEILAYLCRHLPIERVLIAGIETGVWKSADQPADIYSVLTPELFKTDISNIKNSIATDVTGGMRSKVEILLSILKEHPSIEVSIFCGAESNNLLNALRGENIGTTLRNR